MGFRFYRRPAFPGEWNHELIWPVGFLVSVLVGWGFFSFGLETPGCIFHGLTHLPCLGCGTTRCARALIQGDFLAAVKFHPGFFTMIILASFWTVYSAIFWLRRDRLRLRFAVRDEGRMKLTIIILISVGLHWAWQFYYLRHS